MAASSILENIRIDNSEFIEKYVDAMETSAGASGVQKRTNANIVVADNADGRRLSELRRKKRIIAK